MACFRILAKTNPAHTKISHIATRSSAKLAAAMRPSGELGNPFAFSDGRRFCHINSEYTVCINLLQVPRCGRGIRVHGTFALLFRYF